jgi:hypothetical protein
LQNLAEGLPDRLPEVQDTVRPEPYALRTLERLGIYLRSLSVVELRESVSGRGLFDDLPRRRAAERHEVAADRLLRSAVLNAVRRYEELFGAPPVEATAPQAVAEHTRRIRDALGRAWAAAPRQGEDVDPRAFRDFVSSHPEHREAADYLAALSDLFKELRLMGLTSAEPRTARSAVLAPITPPEMSRFELGRVVDAI